MRGLASERSIITHFIFGRMRCFKDAILSDLDNLDYIARIFKGEEVLLRLQTRLVMKKAADKVL